MAVRALTVDSIMQSTILYASWGGLTAGDEGAPFVADGMSLVGVIWGGSLGTLPNFQAQVAHDNPPSLFSSIPSLVSLALGLITPAQETYPVYAKAFKPVCSAGVGTNATCVMIFKRV